MMIRNGRTPSFILIGLVVVILIISFNYWSLLKNNSAQKDSTQACDEMLKEVLGQKSHLEKQNSISANRLKYFEERMDAQDVTLKKKDSELDEINEKLKTKTQDLEKLAIEINELKTKQNSSDSQAEERLKSLKADSERQLVENNALKNNLTQLLSQSVKDTNPTILPTSSCETAVNSSLTKLTEQILILLTHQQLDATIIKDLSAKVNDALQTVLVGAAAISSKNKDRMIKSVELVEKVIPSPVNANAQVESTNFIDICKLEKDSGFENCTESHENYYYSKDSQSCLVLVWTGCGGNKNRFETLKQCQDKCVSNLTAAAVQKVDDEIPAIQKRRRQIGSNALLDILKNGTATEVVTTSGKITKTTTPWALKEVHPNKEAKVDDSVLPLPNINS